MVTTVKRRVTGKNSELCVKMTKPWTEVKWLEMVSDSTELLALNARKMDTFFQQGCNFVYHLPDTCMR